MFLQDDEPDERPETPSGALWLGLAHLALSSDGTGAEGAEDPLLVARAIDAQPDQVAYDRVVLDYLGQIADEMSGRQGAWEPRIRERVSRLVTSLKPDTLRRVLEAGVDNAERRRFALTSAEVLAVDAVIEVVEAAAATTGQTISHQLLRLLHKFAHYAEVGPERGRAEAESTLRQNVAQLITDWRLEDPNPGAYTAVLEGMVRQSPDAASVAEAERLECDPELILQLALEAGCDGPRVDAALEDAHRAPACPVRSGCSAPPRRAPMPPPRRCGATSRRRRGCARSSRAERPDFLAVEGLVARLGPMATEPLLDLLERADDGSARGPDAPAAVEHRPVGRAGGGRAAQGRPWYVQRNLLVLLRTLRTWPARLLGGQLRPARGAAAPPRGVPAAARVPPAPDLGHRPWPGGRESRGRDPGPARGGGGLSP